VQAYKWRLRPAIEAEIIRQRALLTDATAATRAEKRNILADVMRDTNVPAPARVNAIQADNRMTGDDEPMRVHVSGHVTFSVDPIGDGTRGQRVVEELGAEELAEASKRASLPAADATLTLEP